METETIDYFEHYQIPLWEVEESQAEVDDLAVFDFTGEDYYKPKRIKTS